MEPVATGRVPSNASAIAQGLPRSPKTAPTATKHLDVWSEASADAQQGRARLRATFLAGARLGRTRRRAPKNVVGRSNALQGRGSSCQDGAPGTAHEAADAELPHDENGMREQMTSRDEADHKSASPCGALTPRIGRKPGSRTPMTSSAPSRAPAAGLPAMCRPVNASGAPCRTEPGFPHPGVTLAPTGIICTKTQLLLDAEHPST